MTALAPLRPVRPALSPAARALRLQRIFARLQEDASYKDIAAEEGLSRERFRRIVRGATERRKAAPDDKSHPLVYRAGLTPSHRRGPPRRAIEMSTMYPVQSVSDLTDQTLPDPAPQGTHKGGGNALQRSFSG